MLKKAKMNLEREEKEEQEQKEDLEAGVLGRKGSPNL